MKIDVQKLDILLAQRCMNARDLRAGTSPQTLARIRRGGDVLPATLGRIAKTLGVDPVELIEEV